MLDGPLCPIESDRAAAYVWYVQKSDFVLSPTRLRFYEDLFSPSLPRSLLLHANEEFRVVAEGGRRYLGRPPFLFLQFILSRELAREERRG